METLWPDGCVAGVVAIAGVLACANSRSRERSERAAYGRALQGTSTLMADNRAGKPSNHRASYASLNFGGTGIRRHA